MSLIPLFKVFVDTCAMDQVNQVMMSGYIGEGNQVQRFEENFGKYVHNPNVVAVQSGTAALTIALRLAGVGHGDWVVTTPMTCLATNMPILSVGANPIWADILPDGTIDPADVSYKMRPDVKAIICMDWGGLPCKLNELREIADHWGVPLIHDACQSIGGGYNGKPTCGGSPADYVCFPAQTPVTTLDGKKRIDKINVGDMVLSEDGTFHAVEQVHIRSYKGDWSRISVGQTKLSATSNHPLKVFRSGKDVWLPASEITCDDMVYVLTKSCPRCKKEKIPFYVNVCETCFTEADHSEEKRNKLSLKKSTKKRQTSRLIHHFNHVVPQMKKYVDEGYRVIPVIYAIPDFIAIKHGKIIAVEVESGSTVRINKRDKYDKLEENNYDEVRWITKETKRVGKRYQYEIVGDLARVKVASTRNFFWGTTRKVYNLTVKDDPTYFARGILVHNCTSFQAIKHLTTGDGGAIMCLKKEDHERARLMKWFGLDRTKSENLRCGQDPPMWGYKFQMNDIAAAIGLSNLRTICYIVRKTRANAQYYNRHLQGLEHFKVIPFDRERGRSGHWLYTCFVEDVPRFIKYMAENGVMCAKVHDRNDIKTVFNASKREDLPGVDYFDAHHVCIPVGWWVDPPDRERIAELIKAYNGKG